VAPTRLLLAKGKWTWHRPCNAPGASRSPGGLDGADHSQKKCVGVVQRGGVSRIGAENSCMLALVQRPSLDTAPSRHYRRGRSISPQQGALGLDVRAQRLRTDPDGQTTHTPAPSRDNGHRPARNPELPPPRLQERVCLCRWRARRPVYQKHVPAGYVLPADSKQHRATSETWMRCAPDASHENIADTTDPETHADDRLGWEKHSFGKFFFVTPRPRK